MPVFLLLQTLILQLIQSHFENHTLIELLLSSLNYKSVEITLINGVTVRGVLEYRKVMLDKIQYKSINYKKLKIVILRDCAFSQRNAESPARSFKIESVFIPLRAISSLTSPEIDDPLKHLRSYLKKSILNI